MDHRKMTQGELFDMAKGIFGDNPLDFAFQCPTCGDVAKIADWPDESKHLAGQECIGRTLGALRKEANHKAGKYKGRGCDWAAYGLFRGPWEIVMEDGHSAWSFPLAGADQGVLA